MRRENLGRQREAALTPQVLSECVYVVADPRRFERPLPMAHALARASFWWNAKDVEVSPRDGDDHTRTRS